MRIALAGFLHETNTFSSVLTDFEDFQRVDFWPGLKRGRAIVEDLAGLNVGITGAIDVLTTAGCELVPLTWANAPPSGRVTRLAYETIVDHIVRDLRAAGPVHGVFLELHGAMVTEHLEDPEGELLARIRSLVGPDVPIVATLDLHANVSEMMLAQADAIEAYRTYPHIDIAATGRRGAQLLRELVQRPRPWHKAHRRLSYLIPIPWQCTEIEPARSFYANLIASVSGDVSALSFTPGFYPADVPCCGPVLFGYGRNPQNLENVVEHLHQELEEAESRFSGDVYDASEAVAVALQRSVGASGPVVIADAEDNPGGGGTGDTTAILRELLRQNARDSVVATICDPRAARQAHETGEGGEVETALGGSRDGEPFRGRFAVERIGTGAFEATGPMFRGSRIEIGPTALLRLDGVRVVVASRAFQVADQAILRHVQVEPSRQKLLALKSAVHFRNDFQAIASAIVVAAAGGLAPIDPRKLSFSRLDPSLRLFPRRLANA